MQNFLVCLQLLTVLLFAVTVSAASNTVNLPQCMRLYAAGDDRLGFSVDIGDVNNDGINDIIAGAWDDNPLGRPSSTGAVYVIYGPVCDSFNLTSLNRSTGYIIQGTASSTTGIAVRSGDVNGDGIDDVIVGMQTASPLDRPGAGSVAVVYGINGARDDVDLQTLNITTGYFIIGANPGNVLGGHIVVADYNDDGVEDIIIGDPYVDRVVGQVGVVYVVFGINSPTRPDVDLFAFSPTDGFTVHGVVGGSFTGSAVAVGDINNDTFVDLVIGAINYPPALTGAAYVVYGGVYVDVDLGIPDITKWFQISGDQTGGSVGTAVAVGDMDADGIGDIIISAYSYNSPGGFIDAGLVFTVHGVNGIRPDLNVATAPDLSRVYGSRSNDNIGLWMTTGNIDNQPGSDLIIGTPNLQVNPMDAFVIYGSPGLRYNVSTETLGSLNTTIVINNIIGPVSAAIGNLGGDATTEVVFGSSDAQVNGSRGVIDIAALGGGTYEYSDY